MLTMSYDDLAARVGAATVVGSTQGGSLIAPETVRRLACDAAVIPTVLGGRGEVLDQGRSTRLATPGQLAALWLRDAGCSFPGCTTPAHWCDAHHLIHWADGGTSDLTNLALLCGRHHSVVHRDQLIGHVTHAGAVTGAVTGAVIWNLIPGNYHRRDDGPPRMEDRPPGDPPSSGQPPDDPPDTVTLTQSASGPDPWGDLWADSRDPDERPATDHSARDRHDPNHEADPWYRAEHPNDQRPPDDSARDREHTNPEANPWADLWADPRDRDERPATDHSARDREHTNPEANPWFDAGPAA